MNPKLQIKLLKEKVHGSIQRLVYHRRLPYLSLAVAMFFCLFVGYMLFIISNAHVTKNSSNNNKDGELPKCCLVVSVLNIGQGDSIYIQAPNGTDMLVDAGPAGGQVSERVGEAKNNIFDNSIDIILATHPDADHVGGFEELLQHFTANTFIEDGLPADTSTYKNLLSKISSSKIQKVTATRGMSIILDKDRNIIFSVLYPDDQYANYLHDECAARNAEKKSLHKRGSVENCNKVLKLDTNSMSIVGKLTYGNTSFLLTGDAPSTIEHYLIHEFGGATLSVCSTVQYSATSSLCSNVLKVGHHGSKYSTSEEFLSAVMPNYAAISVGATNRYGHPSENALEALSHASSSPQVLRTDQVGTIHFKSDGDKIVVY